MEQVNMAGGNAETKLNPIRAYLDFNLDRSVKFSKGLSDEKGSDWMEIVNRYQSEWLTLEGKKRYGKASMTELSDVEFSTLINSPEYIAIDQEARKWVDEHAAELSGL
jgi:hypothetical protein